jgi:hypothetical protein
MERHPRALLASSHLESRQILVHDKLRVNTFVSDTLMETAELLSRYGVALVFCDDRLTDGS